MSTRILYRDQVVHNIQVCDSDLCCPICFEEFEEPKALPRCLHNICRKCLDDIVNTNHYWYVECPICRAKSNLPRGGVDKLPTHHFMQRLVDSIPGRKEKKALKSMIKELDENILKYKEILMEAKHSVHDASKKANEVGERLKSEISNHARKVTEIIQDNAKELCLEVDEICQETYKISEIKDQEQRLSCLLDESVACLLQAQDILKDNLTFEIIDETPVMLHRAQEIAHSVDALELWFSNLDLDTTHQFLFVENKALATSENMLGWLQDQNYNLNEDTMLIPNKLKVSHCRNCWKIERKSISRMRWLRKREKYRQKAELKKEFIAGEHEIIR